MKTNAFFCINHKTQGVYFYHTMSKDGLFHYRNDNVEEWETSSEPCGIDTSQYALLAIMLGDDFEVMHPYETGDILIRHFFD